MTSAGHLDKNDSLLIVAKWRHRTNCGAVKAESGNRTRSSRQKQWAIARLGAYIPPRVVLLRSVSIYWRPGTGERKGDSEQTKKSWQEDGRTWHRGWTWWTTRKKRNTTIGMLGRKRIEWPRQREPGKNRWDGNFNRQQEREKRDAFCHFTRRIVFSGRLGNDLVQVSTPRTTIKQIGSCWSLHTAGAPVHGWLCYGRF